MGGACAFPRGRGHTDGGVKGMATRRGCAIAALSGAHLVCLTHARAHAHGAIPPFQLAPPHPQANANASLKAKFNLKGDCPVFEGVFRYCQVAGPRLFVLCKPLFVCACLAVSVSCLNCLT